MKRTRREHLKTLIATGALAAGLVHSGGFAAAKESALPNLRELAAARGLRYGAAFEADPRTVTPAYTRLFAQQCHLVAPILSWSVVSPDPGSFDTTRAKPALDLARSQRLELTGAHLLWHATTPNWYRAIDDREAAERAVLKHIGTICARYAGQVYAWNVVNEAIEPREGRSDGLRINPFLSLLGKGYFDMAFRAAREADPRALLVYNQDGIEEDRPDSEARRHALLGLLDQLARSGTPIDAVGTQAHLSLTNFRFNEGRYRSFLREIAARGLKIVISELDVLDVGAPSDFAARDQAVADLYARYLRVTLDESAVVAIVTWGLSDRYTWLTPKSSRGFARVDGLPTRPLPFDANFRPKPAFYALARALESAPARPA